MSVTYDVTIVVHGAGGSLKAKLLKIPRESIMGDGYPKEIRDLVEIYEQFIDAEEPKT